MFTQHSLTRQQQRSIPQMILDFLFTFGEENHLESGFTHLTFTKQSIKKMNSDLGAVAVTAIKKWLYVYAVISNDGSVVTCGYRTKHIRRK